MDNYKYLKVFYNDKLVGTLAKTPDRLVASRKDEIVKAVEKLYQTMNFKDITLNEIADLTTFTRTSIYNYF